MRIFVAACLIFVLLPSVVTLHAQSGHPGQAPPDVLSRVTKMKGLTFVATQAPTDAYCRDKHGFPCYSPQEIQNAYGLTSILDAGYTGKGQTIIIIDSYGSPTIAQDLHTFDVDYGLPDPTFVYRAGTSWHRALRPHQHRPNQLGIRDNLGCRVGARNGAGR